MQGPLKEGDWKYLRGIHDEMLHALCMRINEKAAAIATSEAKTPHEQYLKLCRHIRKSDRIVAECFNDWRRSTLGTTIVCLRRHGLLCDSHVACLSDSARRWLAKLDELQSI